MQYIVKLIMAIVSRLKILTMNPIRNLVQKFQMLVNTNVIANKLLKPITKKFRELFHIKPQSEEDYYSVGKLMIAKKLIVLLIVGCCIAVFAYFSFLAEPIEKPVTTTMGMISNVYFDYDDMELMEYNGRANIRAANGKVVYTGEIKNGVCNGSGILYNQAGALIYEGDFVNNTYDGQGKGYSLGGILQYEGGYADNVYEGEGTQYYPNGQIQYQGEFAGGFYSGHGLEYDEKGNVIYEGGFRNGLYHGSGILFYEDGDKRYEGEFVMGRPQGTGTLYTTSGRPCYTGIVANGNVAVESLLTLPLTDIQEMFYEDPLVYFTQDNTCYVYESVGIILDVDCIVRVVTDQVEAGEESSRFGDGWYLPEEIPAVPATVQTRKTEEKVSDLEMGQDEQDKDLPKDFITQRQKVYYFINQAEWVAEVDLDLGSIRVEGVTVYGEDIEKPLDEGQEYISVNGRMELSDCIAIDKVRRYDPTLFANISYEKENVNYQYIYVKNIDYTRAVYGELTDKEEVSYQLCYQTDDGEKLYYYKVSSIE